MSSIFWGTSAAGIVLAIASTFAERARERRRNLDNPGWVPWTVLQILAIIMTFVAAALALAA